MCCAHADVDGCATTAGQPHSAAVGAPGVRGDVRRPLQRARDGGRHDRDARGEEAACDTSTKPTGVKAGVKVRAGRGAGVGLRERASG